METVPGNSSAGLVKVSSGTTLSVAAPVLLLGSYSSSNPFEATDQERQFSPVGAWTRRDAAQHGRTVRAPALCARAPQLLGTRTRSACA